MRNNFDTQLKYLHTELLQMGAMCETAIANATKALIDSDINAAQLAISADTVIDQKEREIENLCLKLLLQQQPVAKDLRQISSALKMITDLERIGDQARDIAQIVTEIDFSECKSRIKIPELARATISMVSESLDAYVNLDIEKAYKVMKDDDVVDKLFEDIKEGLISLIQTDNNKAEQAIYLLMIAKYFERIGDHATNISEWVEFSITGKHKEDK